MKQLLDVVALLQEANPQVANERNSEKMIASDAIVKLLSTPYQKESSDSEITMEFGELTHLLHMAFSAGADWQVNALFNIAE